MIWKLRVLAAVKTNKIGGIEEKKAGLTEDFRVELCFLVR